MTSSVGAPRYALLFLLLASLLASAAFALEQKGVADLEVGRKLDREERAQLIDAALRNAIETWVAEKQPSQYDNYKRVKDSIDADIGGYVLSHTVISEEFEKQQRTAKMVLRANLNEPKLLDTLLSASSFVRESAYLTFVFVAREQVGTVNESRKTATQEKSQTQGIGRERSENEASQTKRQSKTTGVTKREEVIEGRALWDVSTSNEVDAAMGDIFTDARYLVIPASMVGADTGNTLNVEAFIADYATGRDVSPATRREAYRRLAGLKGTDEEIQYLAMGTLDVESSSIDKATGNYRVAVAVTGEVLSILQRGAAVAKVGPDTKIGEGPSELVARNNALKLAAESVASDLVAKLSGRNIR
ncbi:MAG: hypothetical protein AAF184_14285 [Pseudomonadota bacterium]